MPSTATLTALLLAVSAAALPTMSPLEYIKRAVSPGVVIQQCSSPGMLALAYDDGPYEYTSELVDILDQAGAKATFFWTGSLYGCIYDHADAVKKTFASGHQVASHSWSHGQMGSMTSCQIQTEMNRLDEALVNLLGIKPVYMRPPYLNTAGEFLPTMQKMGFKVITNDVDSGDWNSKTPAESAQVFEQAGAGGNGHISLMHEVYEGTVRELTPWLINWAKQNGLRLVTVAECLGDADGMYRAGNFTPAAGPYTC